MKSDTLTTRETLQKKKTKSALIFTLIFIPILAILGIGIALMDTNDIAGILLCTLSIFVCVGAIVTIIKIVQKYDPLIRDAFFEEVKAQLKKAEYKSEFVSYEGKKIAFDNDAIICDGERISYDNVGIFVTFKVEPKMFSNDYSPALTIIFGDEERENVNLSLDGDVLSELDKKNAPVENMSDLRQYLKEHNEYTKMLLNSTRAMITTDYLPIALPKTEEEVIQVKKTKKKAIILSILGFVGAMGFYILVTWLFNSKSGTEVSDTLTFNLVYKLIFTLIVLLLIFVKPKATKLYVKLLFGAFIILYWIALLFLNQRMISLVFMLFAIVFVSIGVVEMIRSENKSDPRNRMFMFGMVLCLFLLADASAMTVIGDGILLLDLIVGLVALAGSIPIIVIFMRKTTKSTYQKKGQKIGYGILYAFGAFFFGMIISFLLSYEINYVFDTSEPVEISEEIIELDIDDEDYYVIVEHKGERIKISVPSSDYYKLAVGDEFYFSLYDGALGFKYYIYEE